MKTISFGGGTAAAKALAAKSAAATKKGAQNLHGQSLLGGIKPKAQLKTDTLSLSKPASKMGAKGLHGKPAQVKPR